MSAEVGSALGAVGIYALAAVGLLTLGFVGWGVVAGIMDARRTRVASRRAGAGPQARGR